jgi:hypothetical protein
MGDVVKFPTKAREITLIELLVRALALNNEFLTLALGRPVFLPEEQDHVMDLISANQMLLDEARRK